MSIKISSLYSCEDIEDFYEIIDENTVINVKTGLIKKASKYSKTGYWYYTLQTKDKKQRTVTVHKLNALAFIKNAPYDVIEHINDNKDDNSVKNLKFSTQKENVKSAFKNGKSCHENQRQFLVRDKFGNEYTGTSKEIVEQSNGRIPRSSIYYLLSNNLKSGKKISYVEEITIGSQTSERAAGA